MKSWEKNFLTGNHSSSGCKEEEETIFIRWALHIIIYRKNIGSGSFKGVNADVPVHWMRGEVLQL